jgi:hypothetical protein
MGASGATSYAAEPAAGRPPRTKGRPGGKLPAGNRAMRSPRYIVLRISRLKACTLGANDRLVFTGQTDAEPGSRQARAAGLPAFFRRASASGCGGDLNRRRCIAIAAPPTA